MKAVALLLIAAGVVVAAVMADPHTPTQTGGDTSYSRPSYNSYGSPPNYGSPSYGSPSYGSHPSYGRGNYNNYGRYPPVFNQERPLDELDKLYQRLDNVLAQLKAYSEQYEALAARVTQQNKRLGQLTGENLPDRGELDVQQDGLINDLSNEMSTLTDQVNNDLTPAVSDLTNTNSQNRQDMESTAGRMASQNALIMAQLSQTTGLARSVKNFKDTLLLTGGNEFQPFRDAVGGAQTMLNSLADKENRRVCETGQVTLDSDDRRVEYQYQTTFRDVPQILYGLCGTNFNLDTREETGYGYGYPPDEPNSVGLRANAYSTKTGLTVELFDLGFADSSVVTADVCFQACTIGPGTGAVTH